MKAEQRPCALRMNTLGKACQRCGMIRAPGGVTVPSQKCFANSAKRQEEFTGDADLARWRSLGGKIHLAND